MHVHALLNLAQAKAHKRAGLGFTRAVCGEAVPFAMMARTMGEISCPTCSETLLSSRRTEPAEPAEPTEPDPTEPIVDEEGLDSNPLAEVLEQFSALLPVDFVFVDDDTLMDEPDGPYDPRSRLHDADRELLGTLLGLGSLMAPGPTHALRSILSRALGLALGESLDEADGSEPTEPEPTIEPEPEPETVIEPEPVEPEPELTDTERLLAALGDGATTAELSGATGIGKRAIPQLLKGCAELSQDRKGAARIWRPVQGA